MKHMGAVREMMENSLCPLKSIVKENTNRSAGALHHIIFRGIERRSIFRNDTGWNDFLRRLGEVKT